MREVNMNQLQGTVFRENQIDAGKYNILLKNYNPRMEMGNIFSHVYVIVCPFLYNCLRVGSFGL